MEKKIFKYCIFALAFIFLVPDAQAQSDHSNHKREIEIRSKLWNTSYNNRDSLTFYKLFDTAAIFTSAGAKLIGVEKCKDLCRFLYKNRPDITWYNKPTKIEVYELGHVAYETGNWTEAWTEKGDSSKSELKGKYWIMWKRTDNDWKIISAIFTPLSCKGSYCKT